MSQQVGIVTWINGPVVRARGSRQVSMLELVEVGEEHLVGEVIGLNGDTITIQVYEETSGMRPGAPVFGTGLPLSVELGPGLLRSIFDGVQRPLPMIEMRRGSFIRRGLHLTPLYRKDRWSFTPQVKVGDQVSGGAILGTVPETQSLEHRVMVPPDLQGTLTWVAPANKYTIEEPIARLKTDQGEVEITMLQRWPVRRPRPSRSRQGKAGPLITGQRVLDTFFPLAKGGAAAIPGAFGAGKTVTQHSIAKWADAAGDRLHRLRRARQRDDRGAAGVPAPDRSAHRAAADGAHRADRQHLQYAGGGPRGQHLHRHHHCRILPRHGLPRGPDGRLNFPLGRGAARDLRAPGRAAG